MKRNFEMTINQLCVSSLNQRFLIAYGITPAEALTRQKELHDLCMLHEMQDYLLDFQGYRWGDDPINLTRFLYVLRCFCRHRPKLAGIGTRRLARILKAQCLENLFDHYPTEAAIDACLKGYRRRMPVKIQRMVTGLE